MDPQLHPCTANINVMTRFIIEGQPLEGQSRWSWLASSLHAGKPSRWRESGLREQVSCGWRLSKEYKYYFWHKKFLVCEDDEDIEDNERAIVKVCDETYCEGSPWLTQGKQTSSAALSSGSYRATWGRAVATVWPGNGQSQTPWPTKSSSLADGWPPHSTCQVKMWSQKHGEKE